MEKIAAPVTEYFRLVDAASELMEKRAVCRQRFQIIPGTSAESVGSIRRNNLGILSVQDRQGEEAVREYQKAIDLNPDFAEAYDNLGNALGRLGRGAEAVERYQKALELDPENVKAHSNLGVALGRMGRPSEAIGHLEKALESVPDDAEVHTNLGISLAMVGRFDEAIPHLEKALATQPGFEGEFNLARVLVANGRFAQAIPHFEKANKLAGGRDVATLDFLGGAYSEVGRMREALEVAGRAFSIANQQQNASLIETLKSRIAYYQSRVGRK